MSNRNLTLAVGVCLVASVAAFGQPGVGYVFQLPGKSVASGQIVGYPYAANPLSPAISTLGPNGTFQIVAKPDGTGYYVLGATLQIANPGFTTFTTVNGIGNTPTAVAASPDGNYVVVGAGDAYILSASTNQILLDTTTSGTIVGIAISRDSKFAYVLTNSFTSSSVTKINLITHAVTANLPFTNGGATAIAFSPLGLLYVAAVNRVYEIDPNTFQVTPSGTMAPNATPGPLHFTPDGTTMYFANQTSNVTGGSIVQITLATYTVVSWPSSGNTAPPIDDVIIAGNGRIFAISSSTTSLYDVVTSPLSLTASSLNTVLSNQPVLAAVASTELPSALYLYVVVSNGGQNNIYRVTLANNQISTQVSAAVSGGVLQFVGVPPQAGAGSFLQYNGTQTVAQGATSLPLVARVLDLTGRPIFNLPVNFTVDPASGIVINTPSPTTNADGYVQTTIVAPAIQGTYSITLTAGTANTTFTINVPGVGGGGGGGGGGGISQVNIISGNGQLIAQGYSTTNGCSGDPLTVLVTDVNGAPLQGVSVTFSLTSGTGNLASYFPCDNTDLPIGTTDKHGLARTNFVAQLPAGGNDFESDTIVASTPYGAVSFSEIEFATSVNPNNPVFPPTISLLTPTVDSSRTVRVAQGGVAQNSVTALILANSVPQLNCPNPKQGLGCPIPNVAIRIVNDPNTLAPSPYASCQAGSTLSDPNTGVASCNVVATCGSGTGTFPVYYAVGGRASYQGFVVVTPGTGQNLSIVSGNNQSGSAGQTLQSPLVATVVDSCGSPVAGAQVTWKISQGTATLSSVVSTSGSSGQVTANLTLGSAPGTVQVTVSLGSASVVTFSLTSQAVVTSMTIVSGNNQTANLNTAFALPLTVQIKDANGNPIAGSTVSFAVTSGNASVNPTSMATDSQGRASTTATAAQSAGAIVVTASYASVSVPFSLTAIPRGPGIAASNFQNSASFQAGLVPCGLGTATGTGLAPGITGTISGVSFFGPLPYTLNGLSLSINGVPAPIYQISNTNGKEQVTFQTPCEIPPTTNGIATIQLNGGTSTVTGIQVLQAQPGIFNYSGANGKAYGAVISADDGTYVTASNPAKRGHNYYMIATGLGQTTPATSTNLAGSGQTIAFQTIVGVSNAGAPVFSQIYQANEVGVYAIGFTIPASLQLTNATGVDQPLALGVIVNGQTLFGNPVFLPAVQ